MLHNYTLKLKQLNYLLEYGFKSVLVYEPNCTNNYYIFTSQLADHHTQFNFRIRINSIDVFVDDILETISKSADKIRKINSAGNHSDERIVAAFELYKVFKEATIKYNNKNLDNLTNIEKKYKTKVEKLKTGDIIEVDRGPAGSGLGQVTSIENMDNGSIIITGRLCISNREFTMIGMPDETKSEILKF